jgi:O-succinylbenzoate synthase
MKPITALDRALRQRDEVNAEIQEIKQSMAGWPKTSPMKGLSTEEWTDAAVRSLTDDSLKQMVQVVAVTFKALKDEAMRRGLWEALKQTPVDPRRDHE